MKVHLADEALELPVIALLIRKACVEPKQLFPRRLLVDLPQLLWRMGEVSAEGFWGLSSPSRAQREPGQRQKVWGAEYSHGTR